MPSLPPGLTYVDVEAGKYHSLARRSDGSAVAWGYNASGQADVPALAPGTTYVELAGGLEHSLARLSDGSVIAWGDNSRGQLDVPSLPIGVTYVGIAAGDFHSLARRSDGVLLACGNNVYTESNVPVVPGHRCLDISGRRYQSSAVLAKEIGTPFCFGDGSIATACPCIPPNTVPNPSGAIGHGCANSLSSYGAVLSASGTISPDSVMFECHVAPAYAGFGFLVKGDAVNMNGIASSDGVRCASGQLIRFGGHNAGTFGEKVGTWTYPNAMQTAAVSIATAQSSSQSSYYQLFYRNAAASFCNASTANFSNGVALAWP